MALHRRTSETSEKFRPAPPRWTKGPIFSADCIRRTPCAYKAQVPSNGSQDFHLRLPDLAGMQGHGHFRDAVTCSAARINISVAETNPSSWKAIDSTTLFREARKTLV